MTWPMTRIFVLLMPVLLDSVLAACLAAQEGKQKEPKEAEQLELVLDTDRFIPWVNEVAVSEDGGVLATASHSHEDYTASLWDLRAGKPGHTLKGHTDRVGSVSLSGDGKIALTESLDRTTILWDTATGKKLRTVEDAGAGVMSHDGKHFALVLLQRELSVNLYAIKALRPAKSFPTKGIQCLTLSRDGNYILAGVRMGDPQSKTAVLWNVPKGRQVHEFRGHEALVTSVGLSDDAKLAITGSTDTTAKLWDTATGKTLHTLADHTQAVDCVALSGDGKLAATGAEDDTAILWSTATGEKLHTLKSRTGHKRFEDKASGRTFQPVDGHGDNVFGVALRRDGKLLYTSSVDGSTRIWDTASGRELCALLTLNGGADWLVFTPAGHFDGSERAWQLVAYRSSTGKVMRDEATRNRFHRPGLLQEVMKGR